MKTKPSQIDRQLAYWKANADQNATEQAEFKKLRAAGKLPSIVDAFDVSAYQRGVVAFNKRS